MILRTDLDNINSCNCPDNEGVCNPVCCLFGWVRSFISTLAAIRFSIVDIPEMVQTLQNIYKNMNDSTIISENDSNGVSTRSSEIVDPSGKVFDLEQFIQLLKDFGYETYERERQQDKDKPVYAQIDLKADLNVNGLINGIDLSKLQCDAIEFNHVEGYPYFTIKNEHVSALNNYSYQNIRYNVLKITIPSEIKQNIYSKAPDSSNASTLEFAVSFNVLKIILRKNIIYDYNGYLTKEFICYIKNGKALCPVISCRENEDKCDVNNVSMFNQDFFIAFDTRLPFNPYELFMKGELSIMYLLKQDSLVATTPSIKCEIIDAKNALTLHESDIHYFYKPDIITDAKIDYTHRVINHETSLYETITDEIDCYKMVYVLPSEKEYEIPLNLNFKFTEHCFGNEWSLRWDGNKWNGNNVQGRSNGKIESSKQYLRVDKKYNDYGMSGCYVRCKHDEWNARMLDVYSNEDNFMKVMFSYGKTYLLFKDGTIENAATNYRMEIDRYTNVDAYSKDGYDYLPLLLRINNNDKNGVNALLNRTEKIYIDMIINGALNRLSFRWDELHEDQNFGFYIDLIAELDSVEKVNNFFSYSCIDDKTTRNIELYLRKDYTDPIEEVNWDSSTNAFDYIIKQQFYEIQPNPNAATTLYTDYNITSSKIITADNITIMRSDLNLVTNTVDVVSYDVKDIKSKVETLNSEMAEQMQKTKYLSKKVDEVDMKANIGIVLGATGCVLGATGIGVSGKAISFASKAAAEAAAKGGREMTNTVSNVGEHAARGENILEDISGGRGGVLGDGSKLPNVPIRNKPFALTREVQRTDLTPIIE